MNGLVGVGKMTSATFISRNIAAKPREKNELSTRFFDLIAKNIKINIDTSEIVTIKLCEKVVLINGTVTTEISIAPKTAPNVFAA